MFLDESGDHSLDAIDKSYPMFSLAGCIFDLDYYNQEVENKINDFKIKYFNKNDIVLRSYDIRKQKRDFSILIESQKRKEFMNDLSGLIDSLDFTIIGAVINKLKLREKFDNPHNPYNLCLKFILERIVMFLRKSNEKMIIRVESREMYNDEKLSKIFNNFRSEKNRFFPNEEIKSKIIDLSFNPKSQNVVGLQVADLIAYPIGRKILHPEKENRPFDIIEKKFRKRENGFYNGYGLKVFPSE